MCCSNGFHSSNERSSLSTRSNSSGRNSARESAGCRRARHSVVGLNPEPCQGEPRQGGGFIFCEPALRETIRFGLEGVSVDVLDKNREVLPQGLEAAVEIAERQPPEQKCAYPERWYQWVVYRPL